MGLHHLCPSSRLTDCAEQAINSTSLLPQAIPQNLFNLLLHFYTILLFQQIPHKHVQLESFLYKISPSGVNQPQVKTRQRLRLEEFACAPQPASTNTMQKQTSAIKEK